MTHRRIMGPYRLGPAEAGMCARDAARRLGIRFADGRHNPALLPSSGTFTERGRLS